MLQLRPLDGHAFDVGQFRRLAEIDQSQDWSSILVDQPTTPPPPTLQQLLPETHVSVIDRVIQLEDSDGSVSEFQPATPSAAVTPPPPPSVRPLSPLQSPPLPKQTESQKSIWEQAAEARKSEENEGIKKAIYSWDASSLQQTPFLTELPASYYDTILESHLQDGWLVEKELFFHSIVHAILGIPSMCFKWDEKSRRLQPRWTGMRISGVSNTAVESAVDSLLMFGTRLIRLDRMTRVCKSNPGLFGSVGVAFACCLVEWVAYIQHMLYEEFIRQQQQEMTLMRIHQHVSRLDAVLTKIASLIYLDDLSDKDKSNLSSDVISSIQVYGFYIPHGSNLLAMLCDQVQQHDMTVSGMTDTFYNDLCLALLFHSSTPYMSMLSSWLGLHIDATRCGNGVDSSNTSLVDPYAEFFVRPSSSIPGRFKLRRQMIPEWFVDNHLAESIFRTGNALQLLKRYRPEHPLCKANQFELGLGWSATEKEASDYMSRLQSFVEMVRQYNIGSNEQEGLSLDARPGDASDADMMEIVGEEQQSLEEMQPPRLQPLDTIDLAGEFIYTLQELLNHHHQSILTGSSTGAAASDHYIPIINIIKYHSIQRPLQIWCPLVNESVMHLFFNHFHIKDHFSILYNFFLLGDEVFRSGLTKALLSTDDNNDGRSVVAGISLKEHCWPPKASDLTMALRVTVLESMSLLPGETRSRLCAAWDGDMDIDDLITFGVRDSNKQDNSSGNVLDIGALDFLYLVYRAPHPLDLVITRPVLEKLNRLFSFLLQIIRINAAAKSIYGSSRCPRDLSTARFRVGQFVAALSNYVFGTAIEATWNTFVKRMNDYSNDSFFKSMDLVTFSEYLEHIFDRMLFQCFLKQNQRPIKMTLNRVLEDVLAFVVALETGRPHADCVQAFKKFAKHEQQFAQILSKLHDKGVGRLGNVMNSLHDTGSSGIFGDIHERSEAKYGHGAFVQDLLTRLDVNNYFSST